MTHLVNHAPEKPRPLRDRDDANTHVWRAQTVFWDLKLESGRGLIGIGRACTENTGKCCGSG